MSAAGVGNWSPEGTGSTPALPVPAQPTVTAAPDNLRSLTVSWTAPDSSVTITGYQVQIKWAVGGNWVPPNPPTQTTLSKTFTNLQPNRAHVAPSADGECRGGEQLVARRQRQHPRPTGPGPADGDGGPGQA